MNLGNVDKSKNYKFANVDLIAVSQQFLLAIKTKEPFDSFVNILSNISEKDLIEQINTDDLRKSFWINLYNSYTQVLLLKNPEKYKKRNAFFTDKQITIAQKKLSLDDIEHGILRRSKIKWSLGHLNKIFPSHFEKENRVDKVDYRIHFALNCGAKSCPPIAFYDPEKINKQLDLATKSYLKGEAEYDAIKNSVSLPAVMGWFRKDFGGKKSMKKLLKTLQIIPKNINASIHFKKYNWNLFLENYKDE